MEIGLNRNNYYAAANSACELSACDIICLMAIMVNIPYLEMYMSCNELLFIN